MARSVVDAGPRLPEGGERPGRRRRTPFQLVAQVLGELLITAGVILLLFVGWELWWTNIDSGIRQEQALEEFFSEAPSIVEVPAPPAQGESPTTPEDFGAPAVLPQVDLTGTFAAVYIPRFGEDYSRPVTSGVGSDVLDNLGLGHYPRTGAPGAVGNFALAGHRQTHGQVLDQIHTLVPGDRIYVQTREGYYTYVFRNTEIVLPERADVLAPVPTDPGAEPVDRILTLTSCNPRFGAQERIIAYSALESWRPSDAGPPSEIAEQVARAAGQG
ncbi:class E sortase [Arthrobacter pityocampae]|uniref:Class E sortase n=1 Tax=Arthrobacter pityocampae TaxID=547334 RepID=A0A2S5IVH7_9MICC|nr:class E sortase [Arthrobacter pityocampae]